MKTMFFVLLAFAIFNGFMAALYGDMAFGNLIVGMLCAFVAGMQLPFED